MGFAFKAEMGKIIPVGWMCPDGNRMQDD